MDSKHRSSNDPSPPPKSLAPSILPSASTPLQLHPCHLSSLYRPFTLPFVLEPSQAIDARRHRFHLRTDIRCLLRPHCFQYDNSITNLRFQTSVGALQPLVDRFTPDQRPEYQSKCAHPDHPRCLLRLDTTIEVLSWKSTSNDWRVYCYSIAIVGCSSRSYAVRHGQRSRRIDGCLSRNFPRPLTVLYSTIHFWNFESRPSVDHPPAPYEDDALILHESTILSQYHLGSASPEYCEQLSLTHRSTPARMYQSAYRTDRWISAW